MIDIQTEQDLFASIFRDQGLAGITYIARCRQYEQRYLGAAMALSFAAEKATIVLEDKGKTILIDLYHDHYSVYVWIPRYNAFAEFGITSRGIGYGSTMDLYHIAECLIDAIDFLMSVETYKASNPVAFERFKKALEPEVLALKNTFSHLV